MTRRLTATIGLGLAVLLCAGPALAQRGRIDHARRAIRGAPSDSDDRGRSSERDRDDDDDRDDYDDYDDDDLNRTGRSDHSGRRRQGVHPIALIFAPLAGVTWIPYFFLEHRPGHHGFSSRGRFLAYPYRDGEVGQMTVCWPGDGEGAGEEDRARWCPPEIEGQPSAQRGDHVTFRVRSEYVYSIGGVHRPSAYALLDSSARVGLEAGWSHMTERLPNGRWDWMGLGDVNFVVRIVQHPRFQARAGLGWRYMYDAYGLVHGFNHTTELDIFPVRPLVISAGLDFGVLGYAFLLHARLTLGANLGPAELYLGYDVLLIDTVTFHGPAAGLRLWL